MKENAKEVMRIMVENWDPNISITSFFQALREHQLKSGLPEQSDQSQHSEQNHKTDSNT